MHDLEALERQLAAAQANCARLAVSPGADTLAEVWAADDELLRCERLLSAARGEEHAVPCAGLPGRVYRDPVPCVMLGSRALLAFGVLEKTLPGTGQTPPAALGTTRLVLLQFERYVAVRHGTPNDEVHEGHPLWGKGFEGSCLLRVVHSRWLRELEAINRVHRLYRPEYWQAQQHYVIGFSNYLFECVAPAFTVETYDGSPAELMQRMVERLRW